MVSFDRTAAPSAVAVNKGSKGSLEDMSIVVKSLSWSKGV